MKKIRLGSNFTVFLIFFGITAIDAFRHNKITEGIFWVSIALIFLVSDNLKHHTEAK